MATYLVNKRAVAKARDLIDARQYRVRSRWADVQPRAAEQNAFLKVHGWAEYASWHLALTDGAPDETKRPLCLRVRRLSSPALHGLDRLLLPGRRVGAHRGHARHSC